MLTGPCRCVCGLLQPCRTSDSDRLCRFGRITVGLVFSSIHVLPLTCSTVSNGENGTLSSTTAPLFVSLFPERDRSCYLMVHENSDDGSLCMKPLGFRSGQSLAGLMTLQNFIDGGHEVVDARILVVVKSIGAKKKSTCGLEGHSSCC